ncbi:MAG: MBL fold metallo-hydrolase [Eggerthellaceae bacterium]|nr:MBL fold metallo-hydrolase [Eggerthellaceae bacterium]
MATKLLYQGHGSLRLSAADGRVIYIDPYAGEGYDVPADFILVTHQHEDHNQIGLITQKPGCVIISNEEALEGGDYNSFRFGGLTIEAVEANNKTHDPLDCVGFIVEVDDIKVYFPGDTSKTKAMESFAEKKIDYALFPCDGFYNMDLDEAAECAGIIGARVNIPVHLKPGELFDLERAEAFAAPNKLIVAAGEEIILEQA